MKMVKVQIYLVDGNIVEYEVKDEKSAREHAYFITQEGYRSVRDGILTWYPAHFVKKVKLLPFKGGYYPDKIIS